MDVSGSDDHTGLDNSLIHMTGDIQSAVSHTQSSWYVELLLCTINPHQDTILFLMGHLYSNDCNTY
jgi:hypothetical protein